MIPEYKINDVVQIAEHYRSSTPYSDDKPMIILSLEYWNISESWVYELLAGDNKIFLYERCVELVS